jgi:hypothetical protein
MDDFRTLELVIHKPDLRDFLSECADVAAACEEYRAEYERRLTAAYPEAECVVTLGETNGMGSYYYFDDVRAPGDDERIPWIDEIAVQMVNDWSWLTVPDKN